MDNPLYLYDLEYKSVIGVDEAGRGPLAGPVVAAAVILKQYSEELDEINDSKKLTEKKREKLYDIILIALCLMIKLLIFHHSYSYLVIKRKL